jgi:hypothetical protein
MDEVSYQQSDAGFVIALAMALVFAVLTAQSRAERCPPGDPDRADVPLAFSTGMIIRGWIITPSPGFVGAMGFVAYVVAPLARRTAIKRGAAGRSWAPAPGRVKEADKLRV